MLGGAALAALCIPFSAYAETDAATVAVDSASTGGGDAIIVTAQRRAQNVQDVPLAVTALSGETILNEGNINVAQDVVSYTPNATAVATDGRDRPRWFIRGVGTNNTDANGVSPIGIYRDDVYIANFYAQAFPIFDLERVEILSGPQGTLWGKNTTGGAIGYISRAPSEEFGGYGRYSIGSDNERSFQGAVGGALIPGLLSGRLSFYDEQRDGWITNRFSGEATPGTSWRSATGDEKVGADNDRAWRAQLLFTPSSNLNVLVSYHERNYDGDQTPSGIQADPYVKPTTSYNQGYASLSDPLPYGQVWFAGDATEAIDNRGGFVRVNWDVGDLTLTSISSYEQNTLLRNADGSTSIPLFNNVSRQETPDTQWSQEIRLASPAQDRFNWILGAYYFGERFESEAWAANLNTYASPYPAASRSYSDTWQGTDTDSYALFGSATYNFTPDFRITFGWRQIRETKEFSQRFTIGTGAVTFSNPDQWWEEGSVSSTLVTNSVARARREYERFTYDITPQYDISANLHAYFRYATGFLSGGFDTRRNTAVTPNTTQIFEYQPEYIKTYELGLKSEWFNGRLTANGALFYYDYDSIQVLVILPSSGTNTNTTTTTGTGYDNASGWVRGLDLTFDARPTDALHVRAAFGWLESEYTHYPVQTTTAYAGVATFDPSGNEFTRAPNFTASIGADYTFDLGQIGNLELGTDWRYLSRQYYNPTLEQLDHSLEQGGYGIADAHAALSFGEDHRYRLTASVFNLGDKEYLTHVIAPTNSASSIRYGRPESFLLSLQAQF